MRQMRLVCKTRHISIEAVHRKLFEASNIEDESKMGKCPNCDKEVYFAERVFYSNKDYHKTCFKCAKCNKVLETGKVSEHGGKIYCPRPCYDILFGPGGKK